MAEASLPKRMPVRWSNHRAGEEEDLELATPINSIAAQEIPPQMDSALPRSYAGLRTGEEAGQMRAAGSGSGGVLVEAHTAAGRVRDFRRRDKRRSHEVKKPYPTVKKADAAAEQYNQRIVLRFSDVQSYPCRYCRGFHIGHEAQGDGRDCR